MYEKKFLQRTIHPWKILFILILNSVLFSCSSYSRKVEIKLTGASYCQPSKTALNRKIPSKEEIEKLKQNEEFNLLFSKKSIRLSIAYGFSNQLLEYSKLIQKANKSELDLAQKMELLYLEQNLRNQISLISSEINAVASELGCFIDRFNEIIQMLNDKEYDIIQSNTLYGIMTGAFFTIISGITIYDNPTTQAITILGGLVVGYYSYLAYKPEIVVYFKPKSTILKEIWNGPETSDNFSPAIWYLLNTKRNDLENEASFRELLVQRWIKNNFLGAPGSEYHEKCINLFFKEGGASTIVNMTHRREMVQELKSLIQLLEHDVYSLRVDLSNLKEMK